MTELDLSNTKITELELGQMPKLGWLYLSGCTLLEVVNLVGGFDNLAKLDLSNTKITKLELKLMPKLNKLNLSGCT